MDGTERYRWLNDLLKLGFKRPIVDDDIYQTIKSHESKRLTDEFEERWNTEKLNKRPNLQQTFYKIYFKRVIGVSLIFTILEVAKR